MSDAGKDKARRPSKLRQRSSGFFSRSGRNSLSGDRGLNSSSGTGAPSLLDVIPKADTSLTEDKSLSQYLSIQRTPVIPEHPGQANVDYGRASASNGTNTAPYSRTTTMLSRQSYETSAPSDYQYQSTILTLQTKIMTESHEKEAILAKYQALAKIHENQQSELTAARNSLRTTAPRSGGAVAAVASPVAAPEAAPANPPQADAHLHEQLQSVITRLHGYVMTNTQESAIDLAKLTPEDEATLKSVTPSAAALSHVPKSALLQALTTLALFNDLRDPLFPGLSSKYDSLRASAALLKDTASAAQFNQWRTATAAALISSDDAVSKESTDEFVEQLVKTIGDILARLSPSADKSNSRLSQLKPVILDAITLVRQAKAQNADLDIQVPSVASDESIAFDDTLMDKVAVFGDSNQGKTVQLVVSPVIYRVTRDATDPQTAKVIVSKARVLCK